MAPPDRPPVVSPGVHGLPTGLRLVERIGGGNHSEVFRARDRARGVDVAVKVIEPRTGVTGVTAVERLEREARALARLGEHPGILSIRSVGTDGERGWIVSELLSGGSLLERFGSRPGQSRLEHGFRAHDAPVTGEALVRFTASAAAALAHAHRLGVVHGDLSPGNVYLRADGTAVIGDFGLTVIDGDPVDPGGLTPATAAPERRRGAPPTEASDVYSLGAVVLWLATGEASSTSAPEVQARVDEGVDGRVDARLAGVLRACLARRPETRPTALRVVRMCRPSRRR